MTTRSLLTLLLLPTLGFAVSACTLGITTTDLVEDEIDGDEPSDSDAAGDDGDGDGGGDGAASPADPDSPADPAETPEDPAGDPADPADEPEDPADEPEDPADEPEDPTGPADPPPPPGDAACTWDHFAVADSQTTFDLRDPWSPVYVHQSRSSLGATFDVLQILSFQGEPFFGPMQPGSYSVAGANYADCALCMMVLTGCTEQGQCARTFFADEGSLAVSQMNGPDAPFAATLLDVLFREVTIDPATYQSVPVPGGDTWCLDGVGVSGFAEPAF